MNTEYRTNNKKIVKNTNDDDHGGNKIRITKTKNLEPRTGGIST